MSTALVRLCLFLALTLACQAFVPRDRHRVGRTRLQAARLLDDAIDTSVATSKSQATQLPSWINLPASRLDDELTELQSTELVIGRLAMFGAVGLIGKELMTGESFIEQFVHMFPQVTATL